MYVRVRELERPPFFQSCHETFVRGGKRDGSSINRSKHLKQRQWNSKRLLRRNLYLKLIITN